LGVSGLAKSCVLLLACGERKEGRAGRLQRQNKVSEWRIKPILDFELEMTNAKTYCDADPFN
jgi:hypothetical protein